MGRRSGRSQAGIGGRVTVGIMDLSGTAGMEATPPHRFACIAIVAGLAGASVGIMTPSAP